ncbi:MAG: LicD family protein, partial [Methanobrevibacter sp.]|nr:LicD family protein [Methanobrevibacter sp.]
IIFDDSHLKWHDDFFTLERPCNNNDIVNLKIEFKTIYDYFPILKSFFNNISNSNDLNDEYRSFKKYVDYEKSIIQSEEEAKNFDLENAQSLLSSLNENIFQLSKHYNKKLTSLEKEFSEFKKDSEKTINSHYDLFNTIFLYYDVKPKGFLKYNHELNQELLDFVANICKKYDLEYFLDYGLLLGAVRHNGFIPWDDDVDIGMIRKDYDEFLKVIPSEIERNDLSHLLKISLNMHMFKPLPVLQLLYYCEEVEDTIIAGIDIFPYDFIEDISNCNEYSFKKVQKSVTNNNRNGIPIGEALQEYYDAFNLNYDEQKYIIPGVEGARGNFSGYKFEIFKTEDIFPLKELEFENKAYTVPNNPDAYLTQTYGDYLNLPKVIHHHHDRFDKLRKREDGYKIFEKNIYKLKKINASFIV